MQTRDPRDEPYCVTACKIYRVPDGTYHQELARTQSRQDMRLRFGYMGGLGAWRNFEPDQFTDAEVEIFKNEWRNAHPKIRQFWRDIDRAAIEAVRERGELIRCGMLTLQCAGAFLQIRLPSGRKLVLSVSTDHQGRSRQFPRAVLPTTPPGNSRIAATVTAPMAAPGPRTSSPASRAICWSRRCCGSRPPAIQSRSCP